MSGQPAEYKSQEGAPSGLQQFGYGLIHSQGDPTQNDLARGANYSNQMRGMKQDDPVYQALLEKRNASLNPDTGGALGSLTRVVTGHGLSPLEQLSGLGLQLGAGLYRNKLAKDALRNSNQNMANASANMIKQQQAMRGW